MIVYYFNHSIFQFNPQFVELFSQWKWYTFRNERCLLSLDTTWDIVDLEVVWHDFNKIVKISSQTKYVRCRSGKMTTEDAKTYLSKREIPRLFEVRNIVSVIDSVVNAWSFVMAKYNFHFCKMSKNDVLSA